ncbi:MAG TPA: type II toxin-antitoxin system VapC family toxin [Bdellovibrionota bacterium]|nr:type II toxin-antitoxin system VapC family toxin [Bdellovibrionota bacterium]
MSWTDLTLVDANVLIHAYNLDSSIHRVASEWWADKLSGSERVGLALASVLAFVRITTHPRALAQPKPMKEISEIVSSWFEEDSVDWLHPTERHWEILSRLLVDAQASGNLVPDAHLAALAIEHGATLCTTDRDFSRFPGLKWTNPLI